MAKDTVPVTTPVGELYYVNISGQGKENYNEDGYDYTATVHLVKDEPKTLALIAKIDEVIGPIPKGKNLKSVGYRPLFKDEDGKLFTETANRKAGDTDEETNLLAFAFKTNTTYEDGKTKKIQVFNSNAGKISLGDKKIGNGSQGCISGKLKRNETGKDISISLYLHAVQLVKFEEYVDDAGFESQGEGFQGVEDEESGFGTVTEDDSKAAAATTSKPKTKPRL